MRWLAACHWRPDVSKDYSRKNDWGISWLEMLFSFILFSNTYPPVKTGGQKANAIFWDWRCPRRPVLPQGFTLPFSRPFWPSKPSRWLISFLCLLRRSVRRSVISVFLVLLLVCLAVPVFQTRLKLARPFFPTSLAWAELTLSTFR